MRTTCQIIVAVQESQPVTFEELRLALMALNSIESFKSHTIDGLIEAIESGKPGLAKLKAGFASGERERLFHALKTDPAIWLGPNHTPGTPEHTAGRAIA